MKYEVCLVYLKKICNIYHCFIGEYVLFQYKDKTILFFPVNTRKSVLFSKHCPCCVISWVHSDLPWGFQLCTSPMSQAPGPSVASTSRLDTQAAPGRVFCLLPCTFGSHCALHPLTGSDVPLSEHHHPLIRGDGGRCRHPTSFPWLFFVFLKLLFYR